MAKNKYIETPEKLLDIFKEYKKQVKDKPRTNHIFVGKDGMSTRQELERPLTMEGFQVFCFENYGCVKQYFVNADKRYNEYITICTHIKDSIRQDQIEGGMVGQYNASITQRLNGLAEKTHNEIKTVEKFDFDVND
jgi:hypothetical protein